MRAHSTEIPLATVEAKVANSKLLLKYLQRQQPTGVGIHLENATTRPISWNLPLLIVTAQSTRCPKHTRPRDNIKFIEPIFGMHSTTICGSSLHVRIHLKAKNFWAKKEREKQKIRANKNRKEKTTKNRQKEKKKETRNLQRIIMMNVVRSQNWSAKSQCACICVSVCVCVREGVQLVYITSTMHDPRRVLTSFSYLNCPHIMPGQTNPTRLQLPRSHHPQLSPTQLNSTLNRAEQNSSRESLPVSRALAQLSSSSLAMACGWHRQQKHENFATNSQRTQKNNKLNLPYILCGYWAS